MWHILLYSLLAYLAPFIQQSIRYQLKWRPLPLRKWNERIYCHSFSVYIHFLFSFIPKSVMWRMSVFYTCPFHQLHFPIWFVFAHRIDLLSFHRADILHCRRGRCIRQLQSGNTAHKNKCHLSAEACRNKICLVIEV